MGDLDRKKHDLDVIERVLGGVRDTGNSAEKSTRLISVEVPWLGGSTRSTLELTVGLSSDSPPDADRDRDE
jgi:hypothetical protein